MFVKFINRKQISIAPNPIHGNGVIIANPTSSTLQELGYKQLLVKDAPEAPKGKVAIPYYVDGDVVVQEWEIVDDVEA